MNKPLVSIIMVNWNGGDVYTQTLKSITKITYRPWELIIVDNGSTDGSDAYHKDFKFPAKRVEFIKNNENLGFAPANNQGYKVSKGEYVLLLNNDTKVEPEFLDKMVIKMEKDSSIGAMQPKIYLMDKKGYLDNAGSFLTPTGFLTHWGYMEKDGPEFDKETEIFSAKGACLLARKSVIKRVGLFDDTFQSYFEESDFCWRVWISGWRVIYFPETCIYHKVGYSSKRMSQIEVNYHSIKNRNVSLFKNLSTANLFKVFALHILLIKGLALYYLIKMQWGKAFMIYRALFQNLIHLNSALSERRKIQNYRRLLDKEIFSRVGKNVNIIEMFKHFQRVEANFNEK